MTGRPRALDVVVGLVIAAALVYLVVGAEHFHWDFRIYHRAATKVVHGVDPYELGTFVDVGLVEGVPLPFVYPPVILVLFLPFTVMPEVPAAIVWLVLKLVATGALILVWRRFVAFTVDWRLGLLLLLGFDAALYTDLASGNVAILEALALTLGFDALLRERPFTFAALVVAAGAIKLVPLVFLGALVFWGGPRRYRALAAAVAGAVAIAALHLVVAPTMSHEFWTAASSRIDERKWPNPTTLAFVRDLGLPDAVYPVLALAVLAVTAHRLYVLRPPARAVVPLVFVVAALVLPRFKNYTYIELLPAAIACFHVLDRPRRMLLGALVGVTLPWTYLFVAVPAWNSALEHAIPVDRSVWGYAALYAAIALWLLYLVRVLPMARRSAAT